MRGCVICGARPERRGKTHRHHYRDKTGERCPLCPSCRSLIDRAPSRATEVRRAWRRALARAWDPSVGHFVCEVSGLALDVSPDSSGALALECLVDDEGALHVVARSAARVGHTELANALAALDLSA